MFELGAHMRSRSQRNEAGDFVAISVNPLNINFPFCNGNILLGVLKKLLGCTWSCTQIHNILLYYLQITNDITCLK
jgi:hypothetical protein